MSDSEALAYIKQETKDFVENHPDYSWYIDNIVNVYDVIEEMTLDSVGGYYYQNNALYICYETYTLEPGALGVVIIECPVKGE